MVPFHILIFVLTINKVFATPREPRATAEEEYRLPQIVDVSSYQLALTIPSNSFTNQSNEYTGTVIIHFQFTNDTDFIALHAHHDSIAIKTVTFNNIDLQEKDYDVDKVTDVLRINLVNPVSPKRTYILKIDFTGHLGTTGMYGFYKSSYVDKDGNTQYLATTQFEPAHAREAFPCFDEPEFKATFELSITYHDDLNLNVLANTNEKNSTVLRGIRTTHFEETPKMSTYLLAFIISKFTCTNGEPIGDVRFRVCSRDESVEGRNFALDVGPKIIQKFNDFTNYDYKLSNSKIDQVAIPDFSPGAMENWGLVTYRERALLWYENESSNRFKQNVATIMAHELSHQWFGDLVTCNWWSNIYLNEGFARYFEYHMAHEIFPSWELDKQFVIEQLHSILETDALQDSLAIVSKASTPAEISAKFGSISYTKGASIIRMLAHLMQPDNFKLGLQKYIEDSKFKSVTSEDLWNALDSVKSSAPELPLKLSYQVVFENWIDTPGYPEIYVKSFGDDDGAVIIRQSRFLIGGNGIAYEWFVPITYTTSNDTNKFQDTVPKLWLYPTGSQTIVLPEGATWIILNNQQTGYYRVYYDDGLYDAIKIGLSSPNFDGITEINRAQIVDDLFNFGKNANIRYSRVFEITEFLRNDISYYSWYPALNGYDYLLKRVGQDTSLGKAIGSSLLSLMNKLYESVPISKLNGTDHIYTLKQVLAQTWACKLGHETCVTETLKLFNDYKASGIRPDRNLRTIVYCNGLRYSNTSKEDWEFLWNSYTKSADLATEQVTIISALGCTKDATVLKEYLQKTITDGSGIRPQDASAVFSSVYSGNPEGVSIAYDFLTENYKIIPDKYKSSILPTLIKGLANLFTTEDEVNKLKEFIAKNDLPEDFKTAAEEAVTASNANIDWLTKYKKELDDHFGLSSVGKIHASFLFILIAITISKFL